ncbi:MAG: hypothetical protein Q4D94_09895 [Bacillota bacterium]|nr:hypothetical protein [Bacillota bacterium]
MMIIGGMDGCEEWGSEKSPLGDLDLHVRMNEIEKRDSCFYDFAFRSPCNFDGYINEPENDFINSFGEI